MGRTGKNKYLGSSLSVMGLQLASLVEGLVTLVSGNVISMSMKEKIQSIGGVIDVEGRNCLPPVLLTF